MTRHRTGAAAAVLAAFAFVLLAGRSSAEEHGIPLLQFVEPASWVEVEVIDNVTGGCFLRAEEARERAIRGIDEQGQKTTGDENSFRIVFRIRAAGGRTAEGRCFGAVFFEELYPIEVAVRPGAEAQESYWHGRLGLQKLVISDETLDREVLGVIEDAIRVLFRER